MHSGLVASPATCDCRGKAAFKSCKSFKVRGNAILQAAQETARRSIREGSFASKQNRKAVKECDRESSSAQAYPMEQPPSIWLTAPGTANMLLFYLGRTACSSASQS